MQKTLAADTFEEVSRVFERMHACQPDEPHWYLPIIGVDPAHQDRG
jgi:ribulose bisphosphate carboxylase small subunit